MTKEQLNMELGNIVIEVKDLNEKLGVIIGMVGILKQSTSGSDLAMCNMISLIETNMSSLADKDLSKLGEDIIKISKFVDSLEDKVVKPRKPRTTTVDKPKQTRQRRKKIEDKPVETVEEKVEKIEEQ